jgi:hypothetical protein
MEDENKQICEKVKWDAEMRARMGNETNTEVI